MSIQRSLGGIVADAIVCINLKSRKDRRTKFKRQARKKNFPVTFSSGIVNDDPQLGKWRAHRLVWKNSLKNKRLKTLVVFEDDAKMLTKLLIPPPPEEWDMLYLGGNIQRVITDEATDTSTNWKRVCTLMCHAYVLKRETITDLLQKSKQYLNEWKLSEGELLPIDQWLCTKYHPNNNTYICIPDRAIQSDGYSNTREQFITYNQQLTARAFVDKSDIATEADAIDYDESHLTELERSPMELIKSKDEDGNDYTSCILKLPRISTEDLPNVTLITPTHNNHSGFYFVIRNFYKLQYPKEKLTWIIADDSEESKEVRDLIPGNDPRIKYISCKMGRNSFLPVSKKINLCMNYVINQDEVIVHFFDDQYYPEMSVLSRVKVLMAANEANSRKKCVGCTDFGVFDIVNNKSYQKYYPDANNNRTVLYGPSLCYFKGWWDLRKFDENRYVMETFYFTKGRLNEVIQLPYSFVSINLVADDPNATEADRYGNQKTTVKREGETFAKYDKNAKFDNFFDSWDKDTQNFVLLMKETLDED
jgi:hypothetical protein